MQIGHQGGKAEGRFAERRAATASATPTKNLNWDEETENFAEGAERGTTERISAAAAGSAAEQSVKGKREG